MGMAFSLAATGSSSTWNADGPFNINIGGTWSGSWALERARPGVDTWFNCVDSGGSPSAFTGGGSFAVPHAYGGGPEGWTYRITATLASGTLTGEFVK
jgi:hypothetical protein